jgi:anthranilate synthase component 1
MLYPKLEKVIELSKQYNRITVYREIVGDTFTPISILKNLSNEKNIFLLESANVDKSFSRFSFFGTEAEKVISFKNKKLISATNRGKTEIQMNPFDFLNMELKNHRGYSNSDFGDFSGGFVGFIGYEMANYMGNLRKKIKEHSKDLLMGFMLINKFFVFDNHLGKLYAAYSMEVNAENTEKQYKKAQEITQKMAMDIFKINMDMYISQQDYKITTDFNKEDFCETVKKVKEEIENGEIIQSVISNKFELQGKINPVTFYRALRNVNPSPYMFYLKFDDTVICGSSPEIHLKVVKDRAILKPIAGTYSVEKDIEAVKKALMEDEKEVAEHLMLLDLARNDLYTACEPDSVRVTKSFEPEVYSHVVHIVSEVEGRLRKGETQLNVFMNTFPAGTVSGAPKVRAMELIDKYEKTTRAFYAGCAGYFSFEGNVDTCITIRSAMITKEKAVIRAGAGIVYDSIPEKEYEEVHKKLKALFTAFERIKSMEGENVFTNR